MPKYCSQLKLPNKTGFTAKTIADRVSKLVSAITITITISTAVTITVESVEFSQGGGYDIGPLALAQTRFSRASEARVMT
jgi:hypothetical protein